MQKGLAISFKCISTTYGDSVIWHQAVWAGILEYIPTKEINLVQMPRKIVAEIWNCLKNIENSEDSEDSVDYPKCSEVGREVRMRS